MKATYLIINPNSGTRPKEALPELLQSALGADREVRVLATTAPGDAPRLARHAVAQGADAVVVAGGDGTVNEVATAMMHTGVPLGIIPCGSGNGLARSLAIPQDFRKAAEIIADRFVVDIDCGVAADRPFFCAFGMGFDAEVTRKFESEKRRGRMTYIKSALLEFLNFSPNVYAISIGGRVITERALIVAVCNAAQYGNNAYIAPQASLSDGLLDLTIIHDGPLALQTLAGIQLFSGTIDNNILVDHIRISEAVITRLDDGPAHIDGELFYPGRRVEIGCRPGVLKVIAGRDIARPFRPIATPFLEFLKDLGTDLRAPFQ